MVALLVVPVLLVVPQLLEALTRVPPVAERFGVFTSPVALPWWGNTALGLVTAVASTERALRLRHHWLLDSVGQGVVARAGAVAAEPGGGDLGGDGLGGEQSAVRGGCGRRPGYRGAGQARRAASSASRARCQLVPLSGSLCPKPPASSSSAYPWNTLPMNRTAWTCSASGRS